MTDTSITIYSSQHTNRKKLHTNIRVVERNLIWEAHQCIELKVTPTSAKTTDKSLVVTRLYIAWLILADVEE